MTARPSPSRFTTANIFPPMALSPTQKRRLAPHCMVSDTWGRVRRKARRRSASMPESVERGREGRLFVRVRFALLLKLGRGGCFAVGFFDARRFSAGLGFAGAFLAGHLSGSGLEARPAVIAFGGGLLGWGFLGGGRFACRPSRRIPSRGLRGCSHEGIEAVKRG